MDGGYGKKRVFAGEVNFPYTLLRERRINADIMEVVFVIVVRVVIMVMK